MPNAIFVIAPYYDEAVDTWVFDDASRGIVREPFVVGIPAMIDDLVRDIPNAREGFRLLFSLSPFPGFQRRLIKIGEDFGGATYRTETPPMEGWLCPVLFQFFESAPEDIYVKAESRKQ